PTSGSAPHLPEFPGAGATTAQLKEFCETMHLIIGRSDPPAAPSGLGVWMGALRVSACGFGLQGLLWIHAD
ncbi:hypothetical protein NDU88_005087, partial [Pleurodeles waltl]